MFKRKKMFLKCLKRSELGNHQIPQQAPKIKEKIDEIGENY